MADKVLFRFLTVTDYEEEEIFLREQHKQGWKLRKYILPGFYSFDKVMPEDVVYRLDFDQAQCGGKEEYLQMYRDYGWEYLFDVNRFSYFRKPAASAEDDMEIFSDNASRLGMVERIFKRRMIPLLIIFLCIVVPQMMIQLINWLDGGFAAAGVLGIIYAALFAGYVFLFIHCGKKIIKLRKKYADLSDGRW